MRKFDEVAGQVTRWAGSAWASMAAIILVIGWLVGGLVVGFTDSYQLVANTFTTLVTYLMVFFIQHTQNVETRAMHIKLDELLLRIDAADNALMAIESLSEAELEALSSRYRKIADACRQADRSQRMSS